MQSGVVEAEEAEEEAEEEAVEEAEKEAEKMQQEDKEEEGGREGSRRPLIPRISQSDIHTEATYLVFMGNFLKHLPPTQHSQHNLKTIHYTNGKKIHTLVLH